MAGELRFELPGVTLAARQWGAPGARPVIALHGWLDNAASFDRLAPLMTDCHVVALDSAGHGWSTARPPGGAYNLWQDVGEVLDVARELGWQRFHLVGHSRGAAIATLLAGSFPDAVDRLVLIEGGIPILGLPENAPAELARSIIETRQSASRSGRVFATRAEALRQRADGFSKITLEAAELLARRSLREVDGGGFRWHVDPRLKAASEVKLTAEHVEAFIAAVTAPVLAVLAEDSFFSERPVHETLLGRFADVKQVRLPGGHHLHMEGAEAAIAAHILDFFAVP